MSQRMSLGQKLWAALGLTCIFVFLGSWVIGLSHHLYIATLSNGGSATPTSTFTVPSHYKGAVRYVTPGQDRLKRILIRMEGYAEWAGSASAIMMVAMMGCSKRKGRNQRGEPANGKAA